jgi:hypothetical protein
MRGKVEAAIANGRANAVSALSHAGIRETDHPKERQAESDIDFHVYRAGLHAEDGGTFESGKHAVTGAKRPPGGLFP